MSVSRFIAGVAASAVIFFGASTPSSAVANVKAAKPGVHTDHLHKAAHELKSAHGAVNGKNGGQAGQHVSNAIAHIEAAIQHHKTHLNQTRTGLAGTIATAAHHHHHSQLHEALNAAKAAQKQIASGNPVKAAADITKAHHHVELAMRSHHALIAK
jgi:hypothetical protein